MAGVTGSEPTQQECFLVLLCPVNSTGSFLGYPRNSERSVHHATHIINLKAQ